MVYLKRGEVFFVKIFNRGGSRFKQPLANLAIHQTAPDLGPVVVDPFLQPIGVIPKPVFLVTFTGNRLAGALVGHNKRENREAEEQQDQQEHDQ